MNSLNKNISDKKPLDGVAYPSKGSVVSLPKAGKRLRDTKKPLGVVVSRLRDSYPALLEKFPEQERIKKKKDFQRIFDRGTRRESQYLTLIKTDTPDRKIGIILNRHIRPVVLRNKIKRRIRDIYRRNKSFFQGENVIIARSGIETLSYSELKEELLNLCRSMPL